MAFHSKDYLCQIVENIADLRVRDVAWLNPARGRIDPTWDYAISLD